MRILLTNDDGIDAEGFASLERIARQLSDDVWICAPETEQSAQSRALTLSRPLRVKTLAKRRFAVDGTPTDCVMLAMTELLDSPPDLVLSGVNRGQNMAEDVTFSGTVAGALAGMMAGVPSVALSQALRLFHDSRKAYYETAEAYAPDILRRALEQGWPANVILNVNFPDVEPELVQGVEVTRQGQRDMFDIAPERRTDLRGRDYFWMGFKGRKPTLVEGTDLNAVFHGRVSITPLHVDLTDRATLGALGGLFEGLAHPVAPVEPHTHEHPEGRADG